MARTSTNLNAALEGTEWMDRPIESVLANLEIIPEDKRTGRAQQRRRPREPHALLGDHGARTEAGSRRAASPTRSPTTFGSVDDLKAQVNDAGVKRFGSGWSWLVWDGTGLAVLSTPNQDSPVMEGQDAAPRDRRLGARLLPQLPEPPPRLSRRVVERRRLERRRREARRGAGELGQRWPTRAGGGDVPLQPGPPTNPLRAPVRIR